MEWPFIVALTVAIPVILLPAALVWYLNLGRLGAVLRASRANRSAKRGVR